MESNCCHDVDCHSNIKRLNGVCLICHDLINSGLDKADVKVFIFKLYSFGLADGKEEANERIKSILGL